MIRLSRRFKWGLLITGTVGLMAATVPLAVWLTHTQSAELGNARARCQRHHRASHTVIISSDNVIPTSTEGRLCDTLTIVNRDARDRLIALGRHDSHISYDGVSEKVLGKDESLQLTLIKTGNYLFHDHQDDTVQGTFTVSR